MEDDSLFEYLHLEMVSQLLHGGSEETSDKHKEEWMSKLEHIGFFTGYRFVERLTREWPRFKDELDCMKWVCKDMWQAVYRKQVDNLRTNRQGHYVLQDNKFTFLQSISNTQQYLDSAPKFLVFTCGLIRGALSNLGITSVVTAEVAAMPACKFHVMVQRS